MSCEGEKTVVVTEDVIYWAGFGEKFYLRNVPHSALHDITADARHAFLAPRLF